MAASDNWRELAKEFRSLAARIEGAFQWARWKTTPNSSIANIWTLGENPSFSAQFRPLALRAVRELNPDSPTLETWLDALAEIVPPEDWDVSLLEGGRLADGQEVVLIGGVVKNICGLSADLCNSHEAEALKFEIEEAQKNDPKNRPPIVRLWETFKGIKKVHRKPSEVIPGSVLMVLLGQQYGIRPEEVTLEQIQLARAELIGHYGALSIELEPNEESHTSAEAGQSETLIAEQAPAEESDPVVLERAELLNKFKARGRRLQVKITDRMVAKAAKDTWNDRTMVTWWKRNDKRCKPPHDRLIRAVLLRDPASIWPQA